MELFREKIRENVEDFMGVLYDDIEDQVEWLGGSPAGDTQEQERDLTG